MRTEVDDVVRRAVAVVADVPDELSEVEGERLARQLEACALVRTAWLVRGERCGCSTITAIAAREMRDVDQTESTRIGSRPGLTR